MSSRAAPAPMLEPLRRRARALPTLLRVGFAEAVAYRNEMFVWLLSTTTPLVMLALWSAVARDGPVRGYDARGFAAYFLVTLVVRLLTGAWAVWQMNMEIRHGEMGMRLLKPIHPFVSYAVENLSAWPLRGVLAAPLAVVILLLLGPEAFTADWRQVAVFPLTLLGGWGVYFAAMLAIGSLAFHWHSSLSLFEVWLGMHMVLSGYIIPLDLFPAELAALVDLMPFRYVIGLPVETILGKTGWETTLVYLAAQWTWVGALTALALLLWRSGARRYEAFGG